MIRVGLVDDERLVRMGLKLLVDSQPDMQVVAEAVNGREALDTLSGDVADVVLMDVRMPEMEGPVATGRLAELAPGTKVIILTSWDLDEYVFAAIKAGAAGFLLKDAPPEEIITAIQRVADGDAVIAPSATKRLLNQFAALPAEQGDGVLPGAGSLGTGGGVTESSPDNAAVKGTPEQRRAIESLTDREREVLIEMAGGLSNQEIAASLFVSETTVKTHVSHILQKLGARDRVQAVITAYETGLA